MSKRDRKPLKKGKKKTNRKFRLTGQLDKTRRGFGFIRVEEGGDIFVAKRYMNGAMHGDIVEAEIVQRYDGDDRAEAEILKVVERAHKSIVGRIAKDGDIVFVKPLEQSNPDIVRLKKDELDGAEEGDLVSVKILKYPQKSRDAEGKIKSIIAAKDDKFKDIKGLLKVYGIKQDFPDKVKEEADIAASRKITAADIRSRRDMRGEITFTIDGADSKDFDDAVSLRMTESGNYLLSVHIADVAEYVTEGSAMDKEALRRGNSVYLTDVVVPMLPVQLSNGICSLNPHEDRLALSCDIEVDSSCSIVKYEIYESVINSDERLVYDDVSDLLENKDRKLAERYEKIYPTLIKMRDLADMLYKARLNKGSIDFDFKESKIKLDENGDPVMLSPYPRRVANRMIEEFMLLANKVVAEHFFWESAPFIYRVHEKPDMTKMLELQKFLAGFGIIVKGNSDSVRPKELANALDSVKGSPAENIIGRVMIRSMQKAVYKKECLGHYGLAFRYYCHFTSPIRRYADLFIHRVIKAYIHKDATKERLAQYRGTIDQICAHISDTERVAQELERHVEKIYKARYMAKYIGQEFDGIVSGVTAIGIYTELDNTAEGFSRYDSMEGYYMLEEEKYRAVDIDSGRTFALGDKVRIKVEDVNEEEGLVDFRMLEVSGIKLPQKAKP